MLTVAWLRNPGIEGSKDWFSDLRTALLMWDKASIFWDSPGPLVLDGSLPLPSLHHLSPCLLTFILWGLPVGVAVVLRKRRPWRGTCESWGWLGVPPLAHIPFLFVQTPHGMRCQTSKGWLSVLSGSRSPVNTRSEPALENQPGYSFLEGGSLTSVSVFSGVPWGCVILQNSWGCGIWDPVKWILK